MTNSPKPGNQPDPHDMAGALENDGDARNPATPDPDLAAEDAAAKLGDFA